MNDDLTADTLIPSITEAIETFMATVPGEDERDWSSLEMGKAVGTAVRAVTEELLNQSVPCLRCDGTGIWAADNCCGAYEGCRACGGLEIDRKEQPGYPEQVPPHIRGAGTLTVRTLLGLVRKTS
jgi:hypothetical protein